MYYLLILIKLKLKDVCFLYKALVQNASGMFSAIKKQPLVRRICMN